MKRKIFKPVVFFLDNATLAERMFIIRHIKPVLNGMDFDDVLSQPHLVVTNLSRHGERLDYYLVRCSRCNPHFINRDCYKNALVYGESEWIGDSLIARISECIFTVPPLQYDAQGNILPATVDWLPLEWSYPGGFKVVEKDTNNIVLGDIECQ